MASATGKSTDARRKATGSNTPNKLIVTLKYSPTRLSAVQNSTSAATTTSTTTTTTTNGTTTNGTSVQPSPAPSTAGAAILPPLAPNASAEHNTDSNPATPGAGTPGPMAPPDKKKGAKRAAPSDAKPRAKPGPKKKQRLEEGVEINPRGGHRLGPKANMGAINAGLRALDRTGTPCRKWVKGGFKFKTFTGVAWEIPRWTAPARSTATPESTEGEAAAAPASMGSSGKENKDGDRRSTSINGVSSVNGHADGVNGQGGNADGANGANGVSGDVEMEDVQTTTIQPAPVPIAAAS